MLINGQEETIVRKNANLTKGENRFVMDACQEGDNIMDEEDFKKAQERKREANNGPANVGRERPDTSTTMHSDFEESYRLHSAESKARPGSANPSGQNIQNMASYQESSRQAAIQEDPNEEDKFMVKILCEREQLPVEMEFLYQDSQGVSHLISKDSPVQANFQAESNRQILTFEDSLKMDGFVRMILKRKREVKVFSPVRVMINCGQSSVMNTIETDVFSESSSEEQYFDYAVFKFPDHLHLILGGVVSQPIISPTYKLAEIRRLVETLSKSKIGIDKIFGFGGASTVTINGQSCLPTNEVKKALENCMIKLSDETLQIFKPNATQEFISLTKIVEAVNGWSQNIETLDEVNEEEMELSASEYEDDFEDPVDNQ